MSASKQSYAGPAYNALRTDLLENAKELLAAKLRLWSKHGFERSGFVLVSDGWTDAQGRPLLKFCLLNPKGPKFLKAVDTSGNEKNAEYLALELAKVIDAEGSADITAVILDGASANTAAAKILQDGYAFMPDG